MRVWEVLQVVDRGNDQIDHLGVSLNDEFVIDEVDTSGSVAAECGDSTASRTGVRINGVIVDANEHIELHAAADRGGAVRLALTIGPASEQIIILARASYLRANAALWRSQIATRARAAMLANRWIEVPAAKVRSVDASFGVFAPSTLARCLVEDHGSLTVTKGSRVDATPTVVVTDAGNAPGASPEHLTLAARNPPYPLRLTQTGNTRPGGRIDACNDGKGGTARGSIAFSQFGKIAPIHAPQHLLRLPAGPIL